MFFSITHYSIIYNKGFFRTYAGLNKLQGNTNNADASLCANRLKTLFYSNSNNYEKRPVQADYVIIAI